MPSGQVFLTSAFPQWPQTNDRTEASTNSIKTLFSTSPKVVKSFFLMLREERALCQLVWKFPKTVIWQKHPPSTVTARCENGQSTTTAGLTPEIFGVDQSHVPRSCKILNRHTAVTAVQQYNCASQTNCFKMSDFVVSFDLLGGLTLD